MTPQDLARLTALRHDLHRAPDLSGEEKQTAEVIAAKLRALNPDRILTGVGGHGVAAVFDSGLPGPCAGIRCELDGLPIYETGTVPYASKNAGKGHLCGHDGHMVIVLAVAEALARKRPDKGRAVLIFQPAEETGMGAQAFRADPCFAEISPDVMLSLHNLPGLALGHVEICDGPANCASRGMRIGLTGKTSHAAAPQDGLSPAAAMVDLMPRLTALGPGGQLDRDYALTTVTHARLGEATFGVAPGTAEIWVTLRTVTDDRMQALITQGEDLVRQVAKGQGLRVEISYSDVFESCRNDPYVSDIIEKSCIACNISTHRAHHPQRFSEDFGQFGKSAKSAMFWLGAGEDHAQLHNPDYDFPDALIPIGAAVFEAALRNLTT